VKLPPFRLAEAAAPLQMQILLNFVLHLWSATIPHFSVRAFLFFLYVFCQEMNGQFSVLCSFIWFRLGCWHPALLPSFQHPPLPASYMLHKMWVLVLLVHCIKFTIYKNSFGGCEEVLWRNLSNFCPQVNAVNSPLSKMYGELGVPVAWEKLTEAWFSCDFLHFF
jgi:hypothetical protein